MTLFATNLYSQNNQFGSTSSLVCDSVNTLYSYTYLNHGAMFNVIAGSDITLDHLAANINNGTVKYYIYYKTGSFFGFETNPSAWTIIDSATVTSVNNGSTISNMPTVIPINLNISMTAGDTISLYLTSPILSKVFLTTTTIPWGTIYSSNSDLSVTVARSVYQLFNVPFSTPQIWNGSVSYCTTGGVGIDDEPELINHLFHVYLSNGNLQLELEGGLFSDHNNLEFQLTDLLGKVIFSKHINSAQSSINLNEIPSTGVYICKLLSGSRVMGIKKVLIP